MFLIQTIRVSHDSIQTGFKKKKMFFPTKQLLFPEITAHEGDRKGRGLYYHFRCNYRIKDLKVYSVKNGITYMITILE